LGHALALAVTCTNQTLHRGGPGSKPGQSMLHFLVDKMTPGQIFLWVLQFTLSVSFHQCYIFIHSFIHSLISFHTI